MSRVLVTGAAAGVGAGTVGALLDDGHEVWLHARSDARLRDARDLLDRGATGVAADLADLDQVRALAERVAPLGLDAVVHNAGLIRGAAMLPVNVVAPYAVIGLLPDVPRHVVVSSSMHRGGRGDLRGVDWSGAHESRSYGDSKLFVTALAMALGDTRPGTIAHAVDPGWVPTRMGGAGAPDDLDLAHVTQAWLATSDDPDATAGGGYWFHVRRQRPDAATRDPLVRRELVAALAAHTGIRW